MKTTLKWIGATILLLTAGVFFFSRWSGPLPIRHSEKTLVVGSKNFTENILLAHMIADLIEDSTDLHVDRKVNLGGSNLAWKALLNNDIQLYPEYTGTVLFNFYHNSARGSAETLKKTRELLKQDGIQFTNSFGFNNTYTLAVKPETAKKYGLKTLNDLAKESPKLLLGCDFEFIDRPDGFPELKKAYNMNFLLVKGMNRGIAYRTIVGDDIDVIMAFSTDGQLLINDLVTLEDDKLFFPPYDAGALVRQDTLETYPDVAAAVSKLEGQISEEEMRVLNKKVDYEGFKARTVAHQFLKDKGLIK